MTMRDDVRTAFQRQQSALGDTSDARHRLMRDAMLNRDRVQTAGWQWAAGVAAILIAAIVITTFALVKAGPHSRTTVPAATPSPQAQVSPTAMRNTLNVPDSTPILVFADPVNTQQIDGVTWDGKASGKLANQLITGVGNPQNDLFASAGWIEDRSSRQVMTGTFGAKAFQGTWADDGRHICQMVPFSTDSDAPTTLQLITLGGGTRNVARVGTLHNQTTVSVAACSVTNDRAVVVQSGGQGIGTAQVWVVQLSTGRTLWTAKNDPTQLNVQVVASRDANYVAEDVSTNGPAGATVFGPDGGVAAHLQEWVEAFSWDDSLAVVDVGQGVGPVRLISWRTNQLVWSAAGQWSQVGIRPEPGGGAMAIWLAQGQQSQAPTLFIVSPAGRLIVTVAGAGLLYP